MGRWGREGGALFQLYHHFISIKFIMKFNTPCDPNTLEPSFKAWLSGSTPNARDYIEKTNQTTLYAVPQVAMCHTAASLGEY